MRSLVHLSDLHAGRTDPEVISALVPAVRGLAPDLVVLSGDLTQRATRPQFLEARAFLDSLETRTLVIPGNHDVPLWNAAARFFRPLNRYRTYITDDLSPVYEDAEVVVAGVNTARAFAIGEGRIDSAQVERLLHRLSSAPPDAIRVVVTHHPFDLPPGVHEQRLLGRAGMAMSALAKAGADLFLSGHLHLSHISHSAERYRIAGHSALIVQAGTVSLRSRGEQPSFNHLRIDGTRLVVSRFVWNPDIERFEEVAAGIYQRGPSGWVREAGQ